METDKQYRGGAGNFAVNRQRASEAGKKGGHHSGGNFRNDPRRASEAGKKGGHASHANRVTATTENQRIPQDQ